MSDSSKLLHLEHVEDLIFDGHSGWLEALGTLSDVRWAILGHDDDTKVSTKYDGSPSIVFGHHPVTGRFFVGTKSVFNKEPKINYTEEDIDRNHESEGLRKKLKLALSCIGIVTPMGVYQGDFMYDHDDIVQFGNFAEFTPNTLTYSTLPDSEMWLRTRHAIIGIVVHTQYVFVGYDVTSLADMVAEPIDDLSHFHKCGEVHIIDPNVKLPFVDLPSLAVIDEIFDTASDFARDVNWRITDLLPIEHIRPYVNDCVKNETETTALGFAMFLVVHGMKQSVKLKTLHGQAKKLKSYLEISNTVLEYATAYENLFKVNRHLRNAKDILIQTLDTQSEFETFVNGEPVGGEGYVVNNVKLVNRHEFSRLNFARFNKA